MDAFFAAVEVLDRPELKGLPVVVGAPPDKRGVVSTCSYEARVFGIHSAMPSRTAYKLCPHAVFLPVRGERYHAFSRQVMGILESFTPVVEQVSIDEAFLDVSGVRRRWPDPVELAREMKRRIREETGGLTASVGIAPNKFLAKLCSDLHKPDGLTVAPDTPGAIRAFLAPMPTGKIWGVGRVTAATLAQAGIATIGQIQTCPEARLETLLGTASALHIRRLAFGLDDRRVEAEAVPEKSISNETTFDEDCADLGRVRQTLLELAEEVGRRLRAAGRIAKTVHLKIRFGDFKTITRQGPMQPPGSSDRELIRHALALWEKEGVTRPIRLVGVGVTPADADSAPGAEAAARQAEQPLLFELDAVSPPPPPGKKTGDAPRQESGTEEDRQTRARLDAAVDDLRRRYGAAILRRGLWKKSDAGSGKTE